jgi:hypothetical protein
MKKMFLIVWMVCCVFESYAHAQDYVVHMGNLKVQTCEQYEELQDVTHVYGSVIISGQMMLCDEVLRNLDLGNLQYISGFLYITLNPYLQTIVAPNLRRASYIVFSGNPFLPTEQADAIGNQVKCDRFYSCIEGGNYSEQLGAP